MNICTVKYAVRQPGMGSELGKKFLAVGGRSVLSRFIRELHRYAIG